MHMREHSAKSAESKYVRILWACMFTDNFTAKYNMENLMHAHAVDIRPSLRIIEGLGMRLMLNLFQMRIINPRLIDDLGRA